MFSPSDTTRFACLTLIAFSWLDARAALSAEGKAGEDRPRLVVNLPESARITAVAFSPSGDMILTAAWNRVELIEAKTGRQLATFSAADQITGAGFSPDGHKVWAVGDGSFHEWNISTRTSVTEVTSTGGFYDGYSSSVTYVDGLPKLLFENRRTGQVKHVDAATKTTSAAFLAAKKPQEGLMRSLVGALIGFGSGPMRFDMRSAVSPDGEAIFVARDAYGGERLFATGDGRELLKLDSNLTNRRPFAFSNDSQQLAVASTSGTRVLLWKLPQAEQPREVRLPSGLGRCKFLLFHPDGERLLCMSDHRAELIRIEDGQSLLSVDRHTDDVPEVFDASVTSFDETRHAAAFSADGNNLLATTSDGDAVLRDVTTNEQLHKFTRPRSETTSCAVMSPNGTTLAIARGGSIDLWDCRSGVPLRKWLAHEELITYLVFSVDGSRLISTSFDGTAAVWDPHTAACKTRMTRTQPAAEPVEVDEFFPDIDFADPDGPEEPLPAALAAALSTDNSHLIVSYMDDLLICWNLATNETVWRTKTPGYSISVANVPPQFPPDEATILYSATLFDRLTGKKIREFRKSRNTEPSLRDEGSAWTAFWMFSKDGTHVLTDEGVFATADGKLVNEHTGPQIYSLDVMEDVGKFLESRPYLPVIIPPRERNCFVELFLELSTGEDVDNLRLMPEAMRTRPRLLEFDQTDSGTDVLHELEDLDASEHSIAFAQLTSDRSRLITAEVDGRVRIWETSTGNALCTLYNLPDGKWAVVDQHGRFDASDGGNIDDLHWVIGSETVALEQLKDRYYEPGLLAKTLGQNNEPLRDVGAFDAPRLFPEVKVSRTDDDRPRFRVELNNRGGGLGRVVVKINGKEVSADARSPRLDTTLASAKLNIDLTDDPRLVSGATNVLEVHAFNAEGYLRSRGATLLFEAGDEAIDATPRLHALVVGVSNYRGDEIDLRYAAKDAKDFAIALELAAKGLFGIESVQIDVLSSDAATSDGTATRENLIAALNRLVSNSAPKDIAVLYLAGHGVSFGGQNGDFYYLLQDAHTADLADPEVRRNAALSSVELTEILRQVPALKQVMILDTCASGKFVEKFTERRDIPSSQIRALERVKDRTGLHILAGCAADRVSYETTQHAQGLLTYSLLSGMRGAALREEQFVDVSHLFNYAADQVPQLARGIGGIQRPILATPRGGASFDIGRVTQNQRSQIPLQPLLPLVLRASFQDERRFRDQLGLGRAVNEQLRIASTRGAAAELVFVDAEDFPGACELVGRYRVTNESVSVRVLLTRGDEDLATFTVDGIQREVDRIANLIVTKATSSLNQLKTTSNAIDN